MRWFRARSFDRRSSVRIGQVPVIAKPARITASRKVSQPVLAVPSLIVALGLLEGVVDGDRKGRVRLLSETLHGIQEVARSIRVSSTNKIKHLSL